jgi:hypothetical protein
MAIQLGTVDRLASFAALGFGELETQLAENRASFFFQGFGVTLSASVLADPAFLGALGQVRTFAHNVKQTAIDLKAAADAGDGETPASIS